MRKSVRFGLGLVALTAVLSVNGIARAADAEAGEKDFKKYCTACHTVEEGKNRVGPSLFGVVGRPSGSISGFAYSPAMKAAGITWTADKLDTYLADPKATVPGNKMTFAGVKNEAERADLIAFLATKK
jgi:cytochrome c